jgi:hypothetical protein
MVRFFLTPTAPMRMGYGKWNLQKPYRSVSWFALRHNNLRRTHITSRHIAHRCILAAVFGMLLAMIANAQIGGTRTLEMILVGHPADSAQYYSSGSPGSSSDSGFVRGIKFGVEEADRTGRMLGWRVTLRNLPSVAAALQQTEDGPVIVLPQALSLSPLDVSTIQERQALVLVASRSGAGAEHCQSSTFYIAREAQPAAARWDSTWEKFGAAQLNQRYRARFHEGMNGDVWAGWLAAKIISEAAFRAGSTKGSSIGEYFLNPDTRFDGHLGIPLRFDSGHVLLSDSAGITRERPCA